MTEPRPMLQYAWLTIKHKWFVLWAGIWIGNIPITRLLFHDWTKLTPSELPHYARQFFGEANDPEGFIRCWIHHQNRHEHHWEYWIPRTGHNRCTPPYPDGEPVPMSDVAIREMVADWIGASRAYEGHWPDPDDWAWFERAFPKMRLHPETSMKVQALVGGLRLARKERRSNV